MFTENCQYVLNTDSEKSSRSWSQKCGKVLGRINSAKKKECGSFFTLLQNPFRHNKNLADKKIASVGKSFQ